MGALSPRSILVALALVVGSGCNDVFGLEPVDLASAGGAGGEAGQGALGGGGADGGEGGAGGGSALPLMICHNPEYDPGLVLDGDFELDTYTYSYNEGPLCQGSYFAELTPQPGGPPRTVQTLWVHPGEPGALSETPCVFYSIAARDSYGVDPRLWLTFDIPGTPAPGLNQLTPAEGISVAEAAWTFYWGRCRVRLPEVNAGFADVGLWVEESVYVDAFSVLPIECDDSIPDCLE